MPSVREIKRTYFYTILATFLDTDAIASRTLVKRCQIIHDTVLSGYSKRAQQLFHTRCPKIMLFKILDNLKDK